MNYNELTRHHFETAAHAGVLAGPGTRRGAAGSRAQGAWVQFDVQIDDSGQPGHGSLGAVRFLAFGCPHVIAVADWIAQQAVGLPLEPRLRGPGLPESVAALKLRFDMPTEKVGRLLIIEDAWIAALSPPG